jgi:glycosyltransferase involved in cell wall biosynthesis
MSLPLSVAIVCKNNETTIGRTLESVKGLAREIVAIDSGSQDGTVEILRTHGARVEPMEWMGHVKTKQIALEACTKPWILCLDSDESVEPDLRKSIEYAIGRDTDLDPLIVGYRVNRKVWYAGRFLNHAWQPEKRLRLVQRKAAHWTGLDPHDRMELLPGAGGMSGKEPRVADLVGTLRHDSFADMTDHLHNQVRHAKTSAASMAEADRRGSYLRLLTSPGGAFFKQLVLKRAFLDGPRGWNAAASTAAATLMKHIALIERTRVKDDRK